jgi:hypothetical protein
MKLLEHLAAGAILQRIRAHLRDNPDAGAADALGQAAAGGLGGLIQWIVANAPELYAFAAYIAALFGVVLPPLPPIPPIPTP